ncbi:LysE family translocator [Rhizobium lusitanum]|uniref:LysE family translocator n=1 Tax=Rhizobium lusitanum TaxID=293958 RepID=UPI001610DBDA|nr:LysE family translocator [Rhizobium lusitanum]QND49192.1 LysE family translocator [Rhizobium lusitanum]
MSSIAVFFSILAAISIGAASPGPSFVLVSRIAVSRSRKAGLAAALGMGVGAVIFATLALAGLNALLMQVEWLYLALKIAGGLYLIYLGIGIWRGAAEDLVVDAPAAPSSMSVGRNFWFGLGTQLSNPKTAIFYGSIFAALLPADPACWLILAMPPAIFVIEAGWYTVVALAFSSDRPRAFHLKSKLWIDRTAGAVMGALGARLVTESLPRHIWR